VRIKLKVIEVMNTKIKCFINQIIELNLIMNNYDINNSFFRESLIHNIEMNYGVKISKGEMRDYLKPFMSGIKVLKKW
jgi:hypothetical protein